jgi:hypothetical protein
MLCLAMRVMRLFPWLFRTLNGETWGAARATKENPIAPGAAPHEDMPGIADRGSILPPPRPGPF